MFCDRERRFSVDGRSIQRNKSCVFKFIRLSMDVAQVVQISAFIIPLLRHFTILGQKNAQNMPRYYTVEQGKNTD